MAAPSQYRCRVILLLDLDCFYAQCERVRLGLDSETCSLALLQWNSTLAVTYPARQQFGIARGDSWDAIQKKSNGKCLAIHLPLLKHGQKKTLSSMNKMDGSNDDDGDNCDVEEMYKRVFHLSKEQRQAIFTTEIGKRRSNTEGKACLERYRLASTRVFGVVFQTLLKTLGQGNFILERASIDELFLDVTKFCWTTRDDGNNDEIQKAVDSTVKVGGQKGALGAEDRDDPAVEIALQRGAWVAETVRQSVLDGLGFTLSAGISTSKLVAKLGASYGKPNGQAVIYPSKIPFVMDETKIPKVRNLGGKLGKKVIEMLPPNAVEPTMGNAARYLSLPELVRAVGQESARLVFDSARGIDHEEVKETKGVLLAKSITTFKSFRQAKVDSAAVRNWFQLLANDVVSRVGQDLKRNHRYPRSCNVSFICSYKPKAHDRRRDRTSKSLKVAFPKEGDADGANKLVSWAIQTIQKREGNHAYLHRIGLCAIDFDTRATDGGISSFFGRVSSPSQAQTQSKRYTTEATGESPREDDRPIKLTNDDKGSKLRQDCHEEPKSPDLGSLDDESASFDSECKSGEDIARRVQVELTRRDTNPVDQHWEKQTAPTIGVAVPKDDETNRDLMLARKLQASYDRENFVLSRLERKKPSSKRMKIDAFFKCK